MLFTLFDQGANAFLYQSDTAATNWVGFLLPGGLVASGDPPPATITVPDSWSDYPGSPIQQQSGGCYLFAPAPPPKGSADTLMTQVTGLNRSFNLSYRYVLWTPLVSGQLRVTSYVAFASSGGSGSVQQQSRVQFRNLAVIIPSLIVVSLDANSNQLTLTQTGATTMQLTSTVDTPRNVGSPILAIAIPLAAFPAGGIQFAINLTPRAGTLTSDFDSLNLGIKYFYADSSSSDTRSQLFPILIDSSGSSSFPFTAVLDALNPTLEANSRFTFTAPAGNMPYFSTGLVNEAGLPLTLTPIPANSGFMLCADRTTAMNPKPHQIDTYYACLSGSFQLAGTSDAVNLLCGLSSVESISLNLPSSGYAGDQLTFRTGQPAHAALFPLPPSVLAGGSSGTPTPLLDDSFLTSWAALTPGKGTVPAPNQYFTQARGAELFGNGPLIPQAPELIGHFQTAVADITANTQLFPLAAYASLAQSTGPDAFGKGLLPTFESQVLSPTRHQILRGSLTRTLALRPRRMGFFNGHALSGASAPIPTSTPQGLLCTVASDGSWSSLLLAQNSASDGSLQQLQFQAIAPLLQDAFQTNQQFLVISQWPPTGQSSWPTTFANQIEIEGWPFVVDIGKSNAFGSYQNLLIFKFCAGSVKDRVANPALWTHAADFNDTANDGLNAVSSYLQSYIANAEKQPKGSGYENFISIVDDPTWNGILALQVDLDLEQLPAQIQSLVTGINLSLFRAHHLGIQVNPVQQNGDSLQIKGNSSLFGLIDYQDPAYAAAVASGASPNSPVAANPDVYDFKVLLLRVLFENTQIRSFQSKIQVTVNQWFGDPVSKLRIGTGSSISKSVVLDGVLQTHNGVDTYVFSSHRDCVFELDSNVLLTVEITDAGFNTLQSASPTSTLESSRFAFSGYLNFSNLPGFDGFSFGGQSAADNGVGLYFSNLYLNMSFDLNTPTNRNFAFDASQIAFNVAQSVPRAASLFTGFPLQVASFLQGAGDSLPEQQGFLAVQVQNGSFNGLDSRAPWWALQLTLNLGTPGALASAMGWSASLLLAWSSGSRGSSSNYSAWVGIQLPGASGSGKLLSLQGVLKLAIGSIQLYYIAASQSYLLKLTQIAIKFFVLTFPPNGSTIFYLFGDPKGGGSKTLGWYAAYQLNPKKNALPALSPNTDAALPAPSDLS